MTLRKYLIILPFSLVLSFLISCSGEGLFYTIQNEVLVADNNMSNIKFADVLVTTNYYVARGVKIWYREKSGTSWSVLPNGGDSLSSVTFFNNKLYYAARIGTGAAVYEVDIDSGTFTGTQVYTTSATTGDYVWLQLYSYEGNGNARIAMNRVEYQFDSDDNPQVVLSELYVDNTAVDFAAASVLDLGNYPIPEKGVAFGATDDMWVIVNAGSGSLESGGVLYYSADNFTTDNIDSGAPDHFLKSLSYKGGTLFLSTRSDYSSGGSTFNLFHYASATAATAGSWASSSDIGYFLSDFAYNSAVLSGYVVATAIGDYYSSSDSGYVLISTSDYSIKEEDGTLADESNYESSDLIDSYVYAFELDSSGSTAKAVAASSTGIWTLSSSSSEWVQE